MKHTTNLHRRRFFGQAGAGLLAWAGLPSWLQAMEGMGHMPKMPPRKASPNFKPDVEINLLCKPSTTYTSSAIFRQVSQRTQKYLDRITRFLSGADPAL